MQRNRQQQNVFADSRRSSHLSRPRRRRIAQSPWRPMLERAWSAYPPVGLLIAAAVAMAGCSSNIGIAPLKPVNRPPATTTVTASAHATDATATPGDDAVRLAADFNPAYPDSTVAGFAAARSTIRYGQGRMDLANLSRTPWRGARLWVNQQYSIPITLIRSGEVRTIRFADLLDENGQRFRPDGHRVRVTSVELQLGDELTTVRYGLGT